MNSTEGDYIQTITTMEDGEGLEAWWKVVHRRAPHSVARAVRLAGLIARPPNTSDLAKVETEIRKWGDHQRTLAKESRERFSETGKVGILLQLLPNAGSHSIVLRTLGTEVEREETAERFHVASNVAMASGSGPAPMDVSTRMRRTAGVWAMMEKAWAPCR